MTLYAITVLLSSDAEAKLEALESDFNEHLAQPFRRVRMAGPLCDAEGSRKGYLALIEADKVEDAQAYLHESPIYRAGLYGRVEVFEYQIQLGAIAD